ncbi:MAG: FtsX-like permease family protein [Verrucomicrobia bacterium]|nr:FtsX-like permease family protein [Verrucomicrobiota bacterium]
MAASIQTQIRLPLAVAFKVVLQGFRVRFGRSIVTVLGVALGIAFLMSILTGQVIKEGVAGEQAQRNETTRMFNFLIAEAGLPRGIVLGIAELGPLSIVEQRLLDMIAAAQFQQMQRGGAAGAGATALLVIGDGTLTRTRMDVLVQDARHRLVFTTRTGQASVAPSEGKLVLLARALRADEVEKAAIEQRKTSFRNAWIVAIALFVTVIGITNSLLMSVTERFREIGTMKCLGALSRFVRQMFLIESALVGFVGALGGAVLGALFATAAYAVTYGGGLVRQSLDVPQLLLAFGLCVVVGTGLAIVAALYPARFASRMLPAHALRSDI